MVRAAIYCRVSTEDQARQGFSLQAQEERLRAYCTARGWEIGAVYVDDGHSGRDANRPAYRLMLEETFGWDTVLVLKMDRVHRNSRNFVTMMDFLREHDKEFVSATESLDTSTALGRFVMDLLQRIAQLESEQIGERVYSGMAQKAKQGVGSLGGHDPLGLRIVDGQYVQNRDEFRRVQAMFGMALKDKSLREIAEEMNRRGWPTRRGTLWTAVKVYRILHNPVYAGFVRWDGVVSNGSHTGIIDKEVFRQTQEALWRRRPKNLL